VPPAPGATHGQFSPKRVRIHLTNTDSKQVTLQQETTMAGREAVNQISLDKRAREFTKVAFDGSLALP
jgi:hypothetical protein